MDVLLLAFPKSAEIKRGKDSVPVGLLYLNAYLRKHGIDSEVCDTSTKIIYPHIESIYREIKPFLDQHPDLVGLNCFSSYQFPWVMDIAEKIKLFDAKIRIVVGGSHPTFFPKEIIENVPEIDYVVVGEGEEPVLALAKHEPPGTIPAIAYRGENGLPCINPRKEYLKNLDIYPRALWRPIQFEEYYSDHSLWNNPKKKDIRLAVPIVSSRSCPNRCTFCSAQKIMGPSLRVRSAGNVLDELEYLVKEKGQNYFEFVDDNINTNRKHAVDIFQGILDRGLDIQISLSSGVYIHKADEDLIRLMAEAGLVMMKLPIEHGNEYIRNKVIGKNLKDEEIFRVANVLKEYNVYTFGLFIMGFPEDTVETLEDSYRLMHELGLDVYEMATLIPFPGTKLFDQCVRDNLFVEELDMSELWKGTINFDAAQHDKIYIKPYHLSLEQVREWRQKFEKIHFFTGRGKPN